MKIINAEGKYFLRRIIGIYELAVIRSKVSEHQANGGVELEVHTDHATILAHAAFDQPRLSVKGY